MITKEEKDKWVEALRGGGYKQGIGSLFNGCGYCCLGVFFAAVKLVKLDSIDGSIENQAIADEDIRKDQYGEISRLIGYMKMCDLIDMNDAGTTFPEIADYIEENIEAK